MLNVPLPAAPRYWVVRISRINNKPDEIILVKKVLPMFLSIFFADINKYHLFFQFHK